MEQRDIIIVSGLSHEELEQLGTELSKQYFRLYHNKNNSHTSVLFSDFDNKEQNELIEIAQKNGITVNKRISTGLTFFCTNKLDSDRIVKAKENGAKILTKEVFNDVFGSAEYSLLESSLIYNRDVHEIFRIPMPLSNFNQDKTVSSFSFDSDKNYTVNLFKQTCTCSDFVQSDKSKYPKGDIRRFCKHLMKLYRIDFNIKELTLLQKFWIENQFPVKENIKSITVTSLESPVFVNFDNINDWWNIFIIQKGHTYEKYGYNPNEERFAYDDKPHGHVKELREQLINLKGKKEIPKTKNQKEKSKSKGGCAPILALPILIGILYLLFN
jgi:ribosomal protein L29